MGEADMWCQAADPAGTPVREPMNAQGLGPLETLVTRPSPKSWFEPPSSHDYSRNRWPLRWTRSQQ
jgi:hypothetical protein